MDVDLVKEFRAEPSMPAPFLIDFLEEFYMETVTQAIKIKYAEQSCFCVSLLSFRFD
jgi:hypothetical protein